MTVMREAAATSASPAVMTQVGAPRPTASAARPMATRRSVRSAMPTEAFAPTDSARARA